jgi:hypothetical protein
MDVEWMDFRTESANDCGMQSMRVDFVLGVQGGGRGVLPHNLHL